MARRRIRKFLTKKPLPILQVARLHTNARLLDNDVQVSQRACRKPKAGPSNPAAENSNPREPNRPHTQPSTNPSSPLNSHLPLQNLPTHHYREVCNKFNLQNTLPGRILFLPLLNHIKPKPVLDNPPCPSTLQLQSQLCSIPKNVYGHGVVILSTQTTDDGNIATFTFSTICSRSRDDNLIICEDVRCQRRSRGRSPGYGSDTECDGLHLIVDGPVRYSDEGKRSYVSTKDTFTLPCKVFGKWKNERDGQALILDEDSLCLVVERVLGFDSQAL